ncbi:MAG TPA: SRPBCC family protein [Gemmatales bacterium]|nr:SRPBCC family protein [Gemmatales bacterium]
MSTRPATDPTLDLVVERVYDVPRHLVWEAWTKPQHLKEWFCPKPWSVSDCEIDLRPGGIFRVTMRSPEGKEFPNDPGCYLEVVPLERLVWTSVLLPGYRPGTPGDIPFTAIITMEAHGTGTRCVATALHRDESGRDKHKAMGFYEGWGTMLDQLVAHVKSAMKA